MSAPKPSGAPKGKAAIKADPAPVVDQSAPGTRITPDDPEPTGRDQCRCAPGACSGKERLNLERFFCREAGDIEEEPEEPKRPSVDLSDAMVEKLARIACQEEGRDPELLVQGKPCWTFFKNDARAFIRMFNVILAEATQ